MFAISDQQGGALGPRNKRCAQVRIVGAICGEALCKQINRGALAAGLSKEQRVFDCGKPAAARAFRDREGKPAHLAEQAALGHIQVCAFWFMQPSNGQRLGQKRTGSGGNFHLFSVWREIHPASGP